MVDPVPHQSFMASPWEAISWGLLEWEQGRDFPTFVILYRCWQRQGRLEVPGSPTIPAGDKHCRVPSPGVLMGILSCMKYLMFIFNVLVFAGGTCLAGMGLWVAVDPAGFQDIVAARAVLSAGAWLLLAVGIALSLLGFLGCCGALRRSRPLLLLFFILVSLVFLTQLIGAILFLVHWKQVLAAPPGSPASLCHTVVMAQSPPGPA
ncbi:tetraspanin-17-like [Oenanthe melanoleuca]|uniref:tetraspanin-17-like n=1 Tax=Oenanthe melanoleuca TaxID=2939378 RepID=UPI0024C15D36|nr:tetraspanin-17-like [Oenanthe melanoleuca]